MFKVTLSMFDGSYILGARVLDGGLVWPCVSVSVCAGTLGKVEKAELWPWGRWEEIIGINKGPDPLILSAPVADLRRIEQILHHGRKAR